MCQASAENLPCCQLMQASQVHKLCVQEGDIMPDSGHTEMKSLRISEHRQHLELQQIKTEENRRSITLSGKMCRYLVCEYWFMAMGKF